MHWKKYVGWLMTWLIFLTACGRPNTEAEKNKLPLTFTLRDFYSHNEKLDSVTHHIMSKMTPETLAGQMIVVAAGGLGKPTNYVDRLIEKGKLGGILLLNGSVKSFKDLHAHFDSVAQRSGTFPLMYSNDAEPSLINRKIKNSPKVPKTIRLNTVQKCRETGEKIAGVLIDIGIQQNYAPVVDVSDANVAISDRSFGSRPDSIVSLAGAFIQTLQDRGIIATAKHFPGHGLVKGDSHTGLVYIDGDLQELPVYSPLIRNGLLSVMIGHIAVKNNKKWDTNGVPATCSKIIVTDLLKNKLGFKGLVITDAMNMGALSALSNPPLLAVKAGCDLILMPADEEKLTAEIAGEMKRDASFRIQVEASVRKIIRMKVCLGLL